MKKLIALLSTVVLLFTSVCCGIVLTSADDASLTTSFYFDFRNRLDVSNVTAGGGTYNAAQDALYMRSSNSGATGPYLKTADLSARYVKYTEGQVLAVKLKLTDTTSALQSVTMQMVNTGNVSVQVSSVEYQKTTDWQLVLIDLGMDKLTKLDAAKPDPAYNYPWKTANVTFDTGKSPNETNEFYISWFGIFNSKEDAQMHYAATTALTTAFHYDFSGRTDVGNVTAGGGAYNATEDALYIRSSNSGATGPYLKTADLSARHLKYAEGQVLAVKLKLTDTTSALQSLTMQMVNSGDVAVNISSIEYQDTTEWQLLLIDLSMDKLTKLDASKLDPAYNFPWKTANITLDVGKTPNETNALYISWLGIFSSAANAQAYYAQTTSDNNNGGDGEEPGGEEEPGGDDEQVEEKFYFDFSSQAAVNATVNDTANQVRMSKNGGFDSEAGGLKIVSSTDSGPMLEVAPTYAGTGWVSDTNTGGSATNTKYTQPMKAGQYLAVKLKLSDETALMQQGMIRAYGGGVQYTGWSYLNNCPAYKETTGWQLVLVSLDAGNLHQAYGSMDGTWAGAQLVFSKKTAEDADAVHVAWIGVFDSKEEAQSHYLATTPGATEDDFKDDSASDGGQDNPVDFSQYNTTGMFFNFSNKSYYNATMADTANTVSHGGSSASITYDKTVGAMKVVGNGSVSPKVELAPTYDNGADTTTGHATNTKYTTPMSTGKVLAYKVKLSNKESIAMRTLTRAYGGGVTYTRYAYLKNTTSYKETTDWQLVLVDLSAGNLDPVQASADGTWAGLQLSLDIAESTDPIFVDWVGVFETEEDAKRLFLDGTPGATEENIASFRDTVDKPTPFFLDFSSRSKYYTSLSNIQWDQNTDVQYDADMGALRVSAKDTFNENTEGVSGSAGRLQYNPPANPGTMDDYPYVVIKLKVADTRFMFSSGIVRTTGSPSWRGWAETKGYEQTEDWQLLVLKVDKHTDELFTGEWLGFMTQFTRNATSVTAGETLVWVEWFGAFKSVLDAYEYAGYDLPFFSDENPSEIFWDFTKEDVITNCVETHGDTHAVHDAMLRAMKVVAADNTGDGYVSETPGRISLGTAMPVPDGNAMADYPLFAMRVKIANTELEAGDFNLVCSATEEKYYEGRLSSPSMQIMTLDYQDTMNWQTVIIDYRDNPAAAFFVDGDWVSVTVDMISSLMALHGDSVWIQWAGAFKSMEDIEGYLAKTAPYEEGNVDTVAEIPDEDGDGSQNSEDVWNGDDTEGSPATGEADEWRFALITLAIAVVIGVISRRKGATLVK